MPALKQKIFCVGLTGGIGSGKTTVAQLFSKLNVPIVDADEIAHQLTNPHEDAYKQIITHFGKHILNDDQTINRKKLREKIFKNDVEKKWLENLLHPLIRQTMKEKIKKINSPYCICVIPLLAEAGQIDFLDRILVVDAPIEMQIQRAKKRDNTTEDDIKKIITAQANQQTRLKIANDIITNNADLKSLENKVNQLHQQYLKNA